MAAFQITTISTNKDHISVFGAKPFEQEIRGGMLLTNRIDAQNFRLRTSEPGYTTDFHLAGDPTLIIIRAGVLRIELQNGEHKDFTSGDMFIAEDNLPAGVEFDAEKHGHRALVVGEETLHAVHIKLGN